jgi:transcriptional regulator with XRE-family HTH domain
MIGRPPAQAPHERMRDLRLAKKWSQRKLARESDVPEAEISKIETGRHRPYSGQARKIAKALGVHADVLFPEG